MTKEQIDLLNHLASRKGVIFLTPEQLKVAIELHPMNLIALCGNAARITDEGRASLPTVAA